MRQGGEVTQLAVHIAWDVVDLADRREHLRLFHRVDAKVGFQVEIQVEHLFRVARLFGHDVQHRIGDFVDARRCRNRGC